MLTSNFTYLCNGIHKSAIRWYVSNSNQLDALIESFAQGIKGELAVSIIGNDFNDCTSFFGDLEIGNKVTGIFRHGCEDAVSCFERDGVEGHVPCSRGIFHDRNFIACTSDKGGCSVVDVFNLIVSTSGCFVATYLRLELQVGDCGIQDWLWNKR